MLVNVKHLTKMLAKLLAKQYECEVTVLLTCLQSKQFFDS